MVLSYLSSYVFSAPAPPSNSLTTPSLATRGRFPSPPTSSSSSPPPGPDRTTLPPSERARYDLVDAILHESNLYRVLGVPKGAKTDEMRRAYIARSRVCHPDKFPEYPSSTSAFQKLSFAYETLSRDSSRRLYDISGRADWTAPDPAGGPGGGVGRASYAGFGDETLNGVLYAMFCDFMEGDFEMIRVLVNALNEGDPALNLGEDAIENLESILKRIRDLLLSGKKYLRVIKFELIRLYEIQHSLRQLSYFDVLGRVRLTMQLARVTLSIPMAIDKAMMADEEKEEEEGEGETETESESEEGQEGERRKSEETPMTSQDPDSGAPPPPPSRTTSTPNLDNSTPSPTPPPNADSTTPNGGRPPRRRKRRKRRTNPNTQVMSKRRLLGPTITSMLELTVGVLERGERLF